MAAGARFSTAGLGFGVAFTLFDQFSGVADSIQSRFSGLDASIENFSQNINNSMGRIYSGMGLVASGLSLLAPVGLGIKYAGEFEAAEIGLTTLLKSEEAAHAAFEQIKQDAAKTPFNTQPLLQANAALISTGRSAEDARATVNALANAVAATDTSGQFNSTLARMATNLQQIGNLGVATGMDIKQFGMAGINIYQVLADATGKSMDELKEMPITYDMLSMALRKASEEGGLYAGATEKMSRSINGKFSTIADNAQFSLAAIGNAVMDFVHPALDMIIELTNKFQEFADTTEGQFTISVIIATLALMGLALAGAGVSMMLSGVIGMVSTVLAPFWPFIAVVSLVMFGLYKMAGSVENLMTLFKGLGEVFMSAGHDGFTMSAELEQALADIGLLDFVVAAGTWFVRLKEFFSGFVEGLMEVYDVTATVVGFIWNILVALFDGIVAVLEFFGIEIGKNQSSLESWMEAGKWVAYVLGTILVIAIAVLIKSLIAMAIAWVVGLWPIVLLLVIIGLVIAAFYYLYKGIMWVWENALVPLGNFLAAVFSPILDAIIAYFQFWWNVISWVGEALWSVLKPAIDAVGEAIAWLGDVLQPVWDAFASFFEWVGQGFSWLWDIVSGFFTGLWDFAVGMFDLGVSIVNGIWEGMKSLWNSMTEWLSKAWHDSILGQIVDYFTGENTTGPVAEAMNNIAGRDQQTQPVSGDNSGQLASIGNGVTAKNTGQYMTFQPQVVQSNTERVQNITIPVVLDGEKISQAVVTREKMEDARN
jgi:tape measure domain-containing protein